MQILNNTLIAGEGKIIRCKCHNYILGTEVYLSEIMKNGKLEPDSIDNYEEINEEEVHDVE